MTFTIFRGTPDELAAYLTTLAPTTVQVIATTEKATYLIIST